ncbi:uncharacterized protein LOC113272507 [Papaver somniferum]|uniref:uncharacterized protein LOC113272507 n=1 Tax=Papaver somniferum TaxID=3469 RepID=UPI000E6FC18C|nr:uncharacterized protein LOC113272507 [Papaver somniferum]
MSTQNSAFLVESNQRGSSYILSLTPHQPHQFQPLPKMPTPETAEHMLIHCQVALDAWISLSNYITTNHFNENNQLLNFTNQTTMSQILQSPSTTSTITTYCYLLWSLWTTRNELVFRRTDSQPADILTRSIQQHQEFEWEKSIAPPILPGEPPTRSTTNNSRTKVTIDVGWTRSESDWININTDGAARGHPGLAGEGFICRDSNAQTVIAVAQPLGITDAITAETWATVLATITTTERQWYKVLFETDSENLMRLIKTTTDAPWHTSEMIAEIRYRMSQIPDCNIQHTYREGNQDAYGLANYAADASQTGNYCTTIWDRAIPPCINQILLNDYRDIKYPRVISI